MTQTEFTRKPLAGFERDQSLNRSMSFSLHQHVWSWTCSSARRLTFEFQIGALWTCKYVASLLQAMTAVWQHTSVHNDQQDTQFNP